MTARYDLEHMSPEEIEHLRSELRTNPAMLQLLVDLKNSEEEDVDIDLLSAYVMSSSTNSGPNESIRTIPALPEDDIAYIETMIKHSSAWAEVHQRLLAEIQDSPAEGIVTEPLKSYQPGIAVLPGWLAGKSLAFRIAFSSFSFATIFIVALLIIPDPASLHDLQMKKPSVVRGVEFSIETGIPELASDLAIGNYDKAIKSLESLRGQGSTTNQIEYEVLLAESNLYSAESNFLGVHRWYDEERLQHSLLASNTAISIIEKHAGKLGSYKYMEYRSRALIVKTVAAYLTNQDDEAIIALKQLTELRGAQYKMVLRLQKYIH